MTNPAYFLNGNASLKRNLRTAFFAFTLTVFGMSLVGCGDRSDAGYNSAPSAGSCNNAPMGFCNEFTGSSYDAKSTRRVCESQKNQFMSGTCPTESRVGACLVYKDKKTESNYVYYASYPGIRLRGGAAAVTEAAKQCVQLKGEWHPN